MGITFHTQGQGKMAVEPKALALEQILALAADLTKDSPPDQIKTVLGKVAKAALTRLRGFGVGKADFEIF